MLQIDSLVQSFLDFVKRFWRTFFYTIFKPTKLIGSIQREPNAKNFTGAYTYLFISTYLSFLVFYTGNLGFLSILDPHSYNVAFQTLSGSSLLVLILIIIPYTVLICILIYLLIKILRFNKGWFAIVYKYALYYFSSVLLYGVTTFVIVIIIFIGWPKNNSEISFSDIIVNETVDNILSFIGDNIYDIVNYLIAAVPLILLVRYYFSINKKRVIQIVILLTICFLLTRYNDVWFERLNTAFQEEINPDKEKKNVFINNYDGDESSLSMSIDSTKSDQIVNAGFFVTNNTNTTYIIPVDDSIDIRQGATDLGTETFTFKMFIKQWGNEPQQLSYLLKPGEIKYIQVQGYIELPKIESSDTSLGECRLSLPTNLFSQEVVSGWFGSGPKRTYIWSGNITVKKTSNRQLTTSP